MATDKGFFNYWVVANSGKGFITYTDSRKFWIRGYPGNVWVCDDIPESRDWVARNSGSVKTKSQAQTIVTDIVEAAQSTWDADEREADVNEPTGKGFRPGNITLP